MYSWQWSEIADVDWEAQEQEAHKDVTSTS